MCTALWVAGVGTALAEDSGPPPASPPSPITDHFALYGLFFWGKVDTIGRFDSATGVQGTSFSAENDLGLSDKDYAPLMEIMFRMAQRSRLRVDFFDLRRSADQPLKSTITFGNDVFTQGERVQSEVNWREMDLTYTYSFLRDGRFELGAGVGVSLIEAEASALAPGTPKSQDFSGATPFPTIAVDGTVLLTRRWSLNAHGQYYSLSINNVSGTLGIYHADLQFRAWPNVAFGAGYQKQSVELTVADSNPSGEMKMSLNGPQVFVRASF